ncbi:alpha/beta fold hydrolase [Spirochaeta cellobiosiphila]|uniref:alpha/beta fold hydrolase n=1 Tax=Spirochaeta cellobiosiphila TaxID=504483 RepID=UPI0003F4EAFB|nr:alpha/beta hydrolase [Spirochaeta cellobiosiphila]
MPFHKKDQESQFNHRIIKVMRVPIHIVEVGPKSKNTILFIHGWPTNWREFEKVMNILSSDFHVIALDLPGIGDSEEPLDSYSKGNIAKYINELLNEIQVDKVTLVGGDIGGQIVYSFLKNFPNKVSKAVIMNVAIPGVKPWDTVKMNPYIWHFKFHLIPELPEVLIHGKEQQYFSYFYDLLVGNGHKIDDDLKTSFASAYSRKRALTAGFNLYRNFMNDEKDNKGQAEIIISSPVLYLRGRDEAVDIEAYREGFVENNFNNIESTIIDHCGHFSAIEQPEKVASSIKTFIYKKKG